MNFEDAVVSFYARNKLSSADTTTSQSIEHGECMLNNNDAITFHSALCCTGSKATNGYGYNHPLFAMHSIRLLAGVQKKC